MWHSSQLQSQDPNQDRTWALSLCCFYSDTVLPTKMIWALVPCRAQLWSSHPCVLSVNLHISSMRNIALCTKYHIWGLTASSAKVWVFPVLYHISETLHVFNYPWIFFFLSSVLYFSASWFTLPAFVSKTIPSRKIQTFDTFGLGKKCRVSCLSPLIFTTTQWRKQLTSIFQM